MSRAALKSPQGSLFDHQYRVEPQSIPKESSERGAIAAKKIQGGQSAAILYELLAAGCLPDAPRALSRDDLMGRIPLLTVNAATARLAPSGPLQTAKYIEVVPDSCRSNAGNRVDGYRLTTAGVDWLRLSGAKVTP